MSLFYESCFLTRYTSHRRPKPAESYLSFAELSGALKLATMWKCDGMQHAIFTKLGSRLYGLLIEAWQIALATVSSASTAGAEFDHHTVYWFSLTFQCIVNIGVHGSEPIRSRVVQLGTLDVIGCVLEAWLVAKGFAVGPSTSASGMPRETKEQWAAWHLMQHEQRQREQAQQLARLLERQYTNSVPMEVS